jgi:phospholipid/cholesterol/gamma-HCH transport system permease protein
MQFFEHMGKYGLLISRVVTKPDKPRAFFKQLVLELEKLGVQSAGIVAIISVFIGAVIAIQTAYNMENPLLPRYSVGLVTRDTLLLEFSSTILALILAGKVGSNIASEIGTMRVTEQIDALDIMGVNSANYLILPKLVAFIVIIPFLVMFSMVLGVMGGYIGAVELTNAVTATDYIFGIQYYFIPYYIVYSLIKSVAFAFIIVTVSAYYGYFTKGGALDVGRSSTKAVVHSTVTILLFNVLLTQLLLG